VCCTQPCLGGVFIAWDQLASGAATLSRLLRTPSVILEKHVVNQNSMAYIGLSSVSPFTFWEPGLAPMGSDGCRTQGNDRPSGFPVSSTCTATAAVAWRSSVFFIRKHWKHHKEQDFKPLQTKHCKMQILGLFQRSVGHFASLRVDVFVLLQ